MGRTHAPDPAELPCKRDRFGLRTRHRYGATLFTDIAGRLQRLGEEDETPAARAFVEAVLRCPYWGLRVLAIRTIGTWRGRHNKAWLQVRATRLISLPRRKEAPRWEALETSTARAVIAPLLTRSDAAWLLETWFADWLAFAPLSLAVLTDAEIGMAIERELAGNDGSRRIAALWLAWMRRTLPARARILRTMAEDADAGIAHQAGRMLRWDAAAEARRSGPG